MQCLLTTTVAPVAIHNRSIKMKLLSSQYNRHDDAGGDLVVKHSKVEVELRSIIKLIKVHKNL